jgi:hypothetical protein
MMIRCLGLQAVAISIVDENEVQILWFLATLGGCCVMGDLPVAGWDKHYIRVPHHMDETTLSGEERGKGVK